MRIALWRLAARWSLRIIWSLRHNRPREMDRLNLSLLLELSRELIMHAADYRPRWLDGQLDELWYGRDALLEQNKMIRLQKTYKTSLFSDIQKNTFSGSFRKNILEMPIQTQIRSLHTKMSQNHRKTANPSQIRAINRPNFGIKLSNYIHSYCVQTEQNISNYSDQIINGPFLVDFCNNSLNMTNNFDHFCCCNLLLDCLFLRNKLVIWVTLSPDRLRLCACAHASHACIPNRSLNSLTYLPIMYVLNLCAVRLWAHFIIAMLIGSIHCKWSIVKIASLLINYEIT